MIVRFWGTRGSIPKPGPTTLRYGGNTSCVEVRAADGTLIVIDCGTGAHELGLSLARTETGHLRGHLLISHTHWDHIQGFPFFEPLFTPGSEWDIYAPGGRSKHIEAALTAQMSYDYHPITVEALEANVRFHDLTEGELRVGTTRVITRYLHHPALTLGYRIESEGSTLVYACDHEPHSVHPLHGSPGQLPIHHEDQRHLRFIDGADLLIHDAQYLLQEFPEKAGWGHTPMERAVDYAIAARVKRLALFHHDPERDDEALEELEIAARARAHGASHVPEIHVAAEGQCFELSGDPTSPTVHSETLPSALLSQAPQQAATVLIVEDDPATALVLQRALAPEGTRLVTAASGEAGLEMARESRPSLIVLDRNLPGLDGLEVCRALRKSPDPRLRDVPIVFLTGSGISEKGILDAFVAGATDFLAKPVKPTLIRSRVRGWLMRTRPS